MIEPSEEAKEIADCLENLVDDRTRIRLAQRIDAFATQAVAAERAKPTASHLEQGHALVSELLTAGLSPRVGTTLHTVRLAERFAAALAEAHAQGRREGESDMRERHEAALDFLACVFDPYGRGKDKDMNACIRKLVDTTRALPTTPDAREK